MERHVETPCLDAIFEEAARTGEEAPIPDGQQKAVQRELLRLALAAYPEEEATRLEAQILGGPRKVSM